MSIGITHSELDELTLSQLNDRIVGFKEQENREWQRTAWLAAAIISTMTGKRIAPRSLLPEVFSMEAVREYTEEEKQKELEEIKKEVGLIH